MTRVVGDVLYLQYEIHHRGCHRYGASTWPWGASSVRSPSGVRTVGVPVPGGLGRGCVPPPGMVSPGRLGLAGVPLHEAADRSGADACSMPAISVDHDSDCSRRGAQLPATKAVDEQENEGEGRREKGGVSTVLAFLPATYSLH